MAYYGTASKAIVWAHNSHVGDAAATEMASRGEYNIGHLCRQEFGDNAYLVGFGTNSGTVAAASDWDGLMEIKNIQPALPKSYEQLCHATGHAHFMLALRKRANLTGPQLVGLMTGVIDEKALSQGVGGNGRTAGLEEDRNAV